VEAPGKIQRLSWLETAALMALFFTSMGVAAISPAMAKLAAAFPGHNYALISTLPTLFIVPTTLWAGTVAGRRLRFRTLSVLGILLFLLGGTAPFFLPESFSLLLVCRAMFGIGVGLRASLGNALVLQFYRGRRQAEMLGYGTLVSNLGGVLFQLAGGALAEIGWRFTFLAYLLGWISLLLVWFQPEPAPTRPEPTRPEAASAGWTRRSAGAVAVITGLLFFYQLLIYPILMNMSLLFAARETGGATVSAIALSLYSVCGCAVGFVFGRVFARLGRFTLVLGCLAIAAGAGILYLGTSAAVMILGSVVMGMANALLTPAAYAVMGLYVPDRGASLGVSVAMGISNLGSFVSTGYLRFLTQAFGEQLYSALLVLMGACCLLALVFLFFDPFPRKNAQN
jgi:MFS family permease